MIFGNNYTLNLSNDPLGTFFATADANGGVDLMLTAPAVAGSSIDLSSGNRLNINLNTGAVGHVSADGLTIDDTGLTLPLNVLNRVTATKGDDTIINNTTGYAYTMTGNGGNDIFEGNLRSFTYTMLRDFDVGDTIHLTNANINTFAFIDNGTRLNYSDSSTGTSTYMSFGSDPLGTFVASSNASGGVNLTLVATQTLV